MKFDKFMSILYRILCAITCILVVLGFCVSCFRAPLSACADELDILTSIFAYEDTYRENLITVNQNVSYALNDSDLSNESKAKIRAVLALQELALRTMPDIYGNPTNPILPDSDTVTFSGSCQSGVYRSEIDNQIHSITQTLGNSDFDSSIVSSDEFSLSFSATNYSSGTMASAFRSGSTERVDHAGHYYVTTAPYTLTFADTSYFTNPYRYTYTWGTERTTSINLTITSSGSIPTLYRAQNWENVVGKVSGMIIGTNSVSVSLPTDSVDTETPWDYYNDTLLPFMHDNYPDITNNYYVFPDGYHVTPAPDPTEPATFPNGGIYIDKQYNIGINIIYPTDESGLPITDASGETVTETQYITDTSPLDGEYSFQMPTLPHLNIYDATLPNPDLSSYSDGIGFIWNACYNILTDTGFLPVVMICFALALFGFILWKLGG